MTDQTLKLLAETIKTVGFPIVSAMLLGGGIAWITVNVRDKIVETDTKIAAHVQEVGEHVKRNEDLHARVVLDIARLERTLAEFSGQICLNTSHTAKDMHDCAAILLAHRNQRAMAKESLQ